LLQTFELFLIYFPVSDFGEEDKAFQMSGAELETLSVGDDFTSLFDAAFEREAFVKDVKASKGKYKAQVL